MCEVSDGFGVDNDVWGEDIEVETSGANDQSVLWCETADKIGIYFNMR